MKIKVAPIDEFVGEHRFLSNFWPVPGGILLDGERYPTVEHAYQAAKTLDDRSREDIRLASSPGKAKRLGQLVNVRPDWDEREKLATMERLVRQKFMLDREMSAKLLATGLRPLVEGNRWNDRFWGVCLRTRAGHNMLGKILMKVRADLRRRREEAKAIDEGRLAPIIGWLQEKADENLRKGKP